MTLFEEVLGYAERDCPIIPLHSRAVNGGCTCEKSNCGSPAKHPRTPHGLKDATTDTTIIREWWTRWPGANVGMATGLMSGLLVIDLDSEEAIRRFLATYPEAGATLQAETGRGRHFYFQWQDGIRNDAGRILGEGIDVRGEGGFVILPPSIHSNGKSYHWLNEADPLPLPRRLREVLTCRSSGGDRSQSEHVERIQEGKRNDTLASLAGTMRRRGMSLEAIEAALLAENAQKCVPPLPEIEVERISRSVANYEPVENIGSSVSAPKGGSRAGTELKTWEGYLSETPEEREWTLKGLLPDSGLVVLGGRGKHGKSTLAIHKARAIALGETFLSRPTKKKPVIYINYEMPSDYLSSLLGNGEIPKDAYVIDRPEPVRQLETIKKLIDRVGVPGVLVIDSFRGAFKLSGDGENSAGGAGVILRKLQDLALQTGWLIIVIHHHNRKSDREGADSLSGTSDWISAPDVIWSWVRPDPKKPGTLTIEGRIPPVEPLEVMLTLDECRFMGTVEEHAEEAEKQRIIDALGPKPMETDMIAVATEIPPSTVRKRLAALYSEGKVHREGSGRSKHPYVWSNVVSAQTPPIGAGTELGANGHDPTPQEWPETDLMPTVWI